MAFDTVPHKRLLTKLQLAGFGDKVMRWIRAFLSDREMRSRDLTISGIAQRAGSIVLHCLRQWCAGLDKTGYENVC